MPQAEASIHIDAPPEVVFDFVADAPRIPEYVHFVREILGVSDGPIGAGTIIKERAKPGPFERITQWEITEFDRPHRQVWDGVDADMRMTLTKYTDAEEGGTRYRQVMGYTMLPNFRPLGWLLEKLVMGRKMQKEFAGITEGIKRIIETEHSPVEKTQTG
jgi:uncharacterized protein YndB with AHSA1/START domain